MRHITSNFCPRSARRPVSKSSLVAAPHSDKIPEVEAISHLMENIEHKQTPTEAAGYAAGVSIGAFRALCRGKHISAAIIVLTGAVLLLGGSFIRHDDTKLFVQFVGCLVGAVGLAGWIFSSTKNQGE